MATITLQVAATVLFVTALFAILSRRVNDGILGKLCWSFMALSAVSILLAANPFDQLDRNAVAMALVTSVLVVREAVLITIFLWRKHNAANNG
jgi:hypothetical protein